MAGGKGKCSVIVKITVQTKVIRIKDDVVPANAESRGLFTIWNLREAMALIPNNSNIAQGQSRLANNEQTTATMTTRNIRRRSVNWKVMFS